jgi:hypothetical protein
MYVVSRLLRAKTLAALPDATGIVVEAVTHLNNRHGVELGAAVEFGGDGLAIGINGVYEHLADYDAFRSAMMQDEDFGKLVQSGDGLFAESVEDTIWKLRIPPGEEPARFMTVNHAQLVLEQVAEAMAFAAEVSMTIGEITGTPVGLATAQSGDRSRIVWVSYGESLDVLEQNEETLEANDEYLDLYKRSAGLVVPNTLEQHLWSRITD